MVDKNIDISSDNDIKKVLKNIYNDPIANILQKNSKLSNIQYESLLIEYFLNNYSNKFITYENMAIFRTKKVSRGSFSRTLSQARKNIISSIYTIILLTYLGIFETIPFDDYKNLAEKLSEYTLLLQDPDNYYTNSTLRKIENELMEGIKSLLQPKRLNPDVISH